MNARTDSKSRSAFLPLVLSITLRIVLGLYLIARYGGYWIAGDTSRTTSYILSVLKSEQLIPASGRVYHHGFLYQAFGSFMSLVSNFSVRELQIWIFLPVATVLTLLAFAFYRQILGDPAIAGAASIMLNLQGDFLFTSSRGTHEKIVFTFVFASLLAMAFALAQLGSLRKRLALAFAYYLTMFALSTTNVFFASTFTVTLILAFLVWFLLTRRIASSLQSSIWVVYISLVALVFIYLVIFVLYPPARSVVLTTRNLVERLYLLLFSFTEPPAAVYETASQAWIFPQAWLVLRSFDILLIATAALGWLDLIRRVHHRKNLPTAPLSTGHFWLLTLFPAFGVQNAIAVISDITGSATGINNLQVRLAPLTAFTAAPLAAYALSRLFTSLRTRWFWHRLATICIVGAMVAFTGIALIKSTSEPLLSNIWSFYTPSESAGVSWLDRHILLLSFDGGRRTPHVWAGTDFRIGRVWLNDYWGEEQRRVPMVSAADESYAFVFLSPAVRMLAARRHEVLPNTQPALRIYDNGDTRLYLKLPGTR